MPVWLVTGGSGFLGRHLLRALATQRPHDVDVVVLGRRSRLDGPCAERFVEADLKDPVALRRVIYAAAPTRVFHLAGQTPPSTSEAFYRGNTLATLHLLDALHALGREVRVVLAGSAAELGPVPISELPVGEEFACRPADAYGLSKWLATTAGLEARPPIDVVVGRIFNPIGPGLPATHAFGRFAAELARTSLDPGPLKLSTGNLESRRDFIDVRDVASALLALGERGSGGRVYHIGTGHSLRVGDGLATLIRLCGRQVDIAPDPWFAANRGPTDSRADITRIVTETGWRPVVPWRRSLEELWDEASTRAQSLLSLTEGCALL